ncbi:coagulation factor IIIa [Lepisosteus oculatus]|uniref:coagulation factor IIIa n=1 Tax=Lepisosteus oculatus TaxID=7918 RepID=UPI00371A4220
MLFYIGYLVFVSSLCLHGKVSGDEDFPKARNLTWSSINFKTILMWQPKPTNYVYTVEYYALGKDRMKSRNCIKKDVVECDLTRQLTDLKETYIADVISEPLPGQPFDQVEFPHTSSERFCPYKDTIIGRPDFDVEVNEAKDKITLHIKDPISAVSSGNRLLNMRDIFNGDLQYKIIYKKAESTGKKEEHTKSNTFELKVDRGKSYCFNVQAYIPTRVYGKQLGELSQLKCSPAGEKSFFEEYGIRVIAAVIITVIIISIIIIALVVILCKRSQNGSGGPDKEGMSLRNV